MIGGKNPKTEETLYVIHEYGAKRHFVALEELARQERRRGAYTRTRYITLEPAKRLARVLLRRSREPWYAPLVDLVRLLKLCVLRRQRVVLGIAPASAWILMMLWLKRRHYVVYFTSWPYWEPNHVPHMPRIEWIWRLWESFLSDRQVVAAVTQVVARAVEHMGARAVVVRHAVDTLVFKPPETEVTRPRSPQVLFVGRLTESKGVPDALEVALRAPGNCRWVFAGSGPLEERLRSAGGSVRLAGFVRHEAELIRLYQESDLLILPSRRKDGWEELFGIVLIEAMACGVVPIASSHVGPREVIADSMTGFLVPEGDVAALQERVERLLANEPLRRKMAEAARSKAVKEYDVRVLAPKWRQGFEMAQSLAGRHDSV